MRSLFLVPMMLAAAMTLPRAAAKPIEIEVKSELVPVRPLKTGEFSWAPEIAPKGKVIVVIDLAGQLAHVYRDGHEIGRATVSTGKSGQETPPGVFTILEKKISHYSSSYGLAPMPFMQRLSWDGVALHGGRNPGAPASHGCVRLPDAFAQALYWTTAIGDIVVVASRWDSSAPEPVVEEMSPAEIRLENVG